MRGFTLVVAATALAVAACSGGPANQGASTTHPASGLSVPAARSRAVACAHPTAVAATNRPIGEGMPGAPRVGPITFHPYPYQPPFPDKVLIHRVGVFTGSLSLTGYNCRDGRILRFWYRVRAALPAGPIRRLAEGDQVAVLRSCASPCTDYSGYMLFTEPGRWNIVVSHRDAAVGNIVITVAPGLPTASP